MKTNQEHFLDLKSVRVKHIDEFKSLFEKIPDFKTTFPELNTLEKELKDEQEAYTEWRLTLNEDLEFETDVFTNLSQYECDVCADEHYHTKQNIKVAEHRGYEFENPIPGTMRKIPISDVSSVGINWKMMTLLRPETSLDEDLYSRLVELDRLRSQARDQEQKIYGSGTDPDRSIKLPSESKGGMTQVYNVICDQCSEEFCYGECVKYHYEESKEVLQQIT